MNTMKDFNTYWKEKAQKRRKAWAAKAKRFAEQHTQLESIRKDVFLPLDYATNSSLDDIKMPHYAKGNPIAEWHQVEFGFSESGLRQAMETEGADMSSFKMEVNKQYIVGKEAPQPKVTGYLQYSNPTKVYEIENDYHAWLKRMYEICTELETCKLTYGQVSMVIRRYSTDGLSFGYYELIPCEQLVKSAMLMEETSFNRLNVATLLMEMAAEFELRQEELNYHAKKLKLRTMEAATIEGIDFELWDDKKLEKKLKEYAKKDYTLDKVVDQVLQPWMKGVECFMENIVHRDYQGNKDMLYTICFDRQYFTDFVNQKLRSYLDGHGLQDVKAYIPSQNSDSQFICEYQGYRVIIKHYNNPVGLVFYPFADEDRFLEYSDKILRSNNDKQHCIFGYLTLSAICEYLKWAPTYGPRIAAMKKKVKERYNIILKQYGHSN